MSGSDSSAPNEDGNDLDEFDAVVDEIAASREEAPADIAAAEDGGDPAPSDQGELVPPGSSEEAGQSDPVAAPAPAETPTDIWATAPAELREAFERERAQYEQRLSSTKGRLSAADRELARLRRESGATPGGQQGAQPGNQPKPNPFDSDQVKQLREEYGEVAGPILDIVMAQADEIAALRAPVAQVTQDRATQAWQSEISVFTEAHPDWETYVSDDRYPKWLEAQPKAVQDAAQRAINVEDGQEAAWLLTQFKQSLGAPAPAPAPEPSPAPQPRHDPKRARQLAAGRDGGGSALPVQSGVPDDFDGALDAIIARRERQSARDGRSF